MNIDKSSPKILCYCLTTITFIVGVTEARIAFKRASYPNTISFQFFLIEAGFWH